jgi:starch phosphorylase
LEIIYEINYRFLEGPVAAKWPNDSQKRAELSIVEESPSKSVNMAKLAVVSSFAVNGVAQVATARPARAPCSCCR